MRGGDSDRFYHQRPSTSPKQFGMGEENCLNTITRFIDTWVIRGKGFLHLLSF